MDGNQLHDRPKVICHILQSIDGRISGRLFSQDVTAQLVDEYGKRRGMLHADAYIYGATTLMGLFPMNHSSSVDGYPTDGIINMVGEDSVRNNHAEHYLIAIDPQGTLWWRNAAVNLRGMEKTHVVEVLCEKVDVRYLSYLDHFGVSYLFAGEERLELTLALKKLKKLFGIETVLLQGGGITNQYFADEGLVDELSLLISPVIAGDDAVQTFEGRGGIPEIARAIEYRRLEVEKLDDAGLWLHYYK